MTLNENDARAVDMLLNGLSEGSTAGAAEGQADQGTSTGTVAVGHVPAQAAGATSAVSAMSDDLANRVTQADGMLRLLDYLPADEPSANLVQRTMRRIEEARTRGRAASAAASAHVGVSGAGLSAGAAAPSGGGLSQGLHLSPNAGGEEDPSTL